MKRVLSWIVWIVGIGLSVVAFAAMGVRRWPWPEGSSDARLEFVGFGLCSVVMLVASVFALRRRRWAGLLLISASLPVAVMFLISAGSSLTLGQRISIPAIIFGILAVIGTFWTITARQKWPALMSSSTSVGRTIASAVFGVGFYAVVVVCTVILFVLTGPEPFGHCGGISSLNVRQRFPWHCVFRARTIRIGGREDWAPERGRWTLTRVQENFWGAPKYSGGYVFVFGGLFGEGEEWLFDTYRYEGIISRYLPIVELRRCGRNGPLEWADPDLRVLRDREPWSGVRIIGTTVTERFMRVPGAKVVIHGPAGETETTADVQGVFDVKGLPAGPYSITATYPAKREEYPENRRLRDLKDGEAWGREVYVRE